MKDFEAHLTPMERGHILDSLSKKEFFEPWKTYLFVGQFVSQAEDGVIGDLDDEDPDDPQLVIYNCIRLMHYNTANMCMGLLQRALRNFPLRDYSHDPTTYAYRIVNFNECSEPEGDIGHWAASASEEHQLLEVFLKEYYTLLKEMDDATRTHRKDFDESGAAEDGGHIDFMPKSLYPPRFPRQSKAKLDHYACPLDGDPQASSLVAAFVG